MTLELACSEHPSLPYCPEHMKGPPHRHSRLEQIARHIVIHTMHGTKRNYPPGVHDMPRRPEALFHLLEWVSRRHSELARESHPVLYPLSIPHLSASYCIAPTDARVLVSVLCSHTEHSARSELKACGVVLKKAFIVFPVEVGIASNQTQPGKTR